MITLRPEPAVTAERLKRAFGLFLTEDEAKIAAAGDGSGNNPANRGGTQNSNDFFQDILQPERK